MTKAPDLEVDAGHLRGWIGHEDIATDVVSADLLAKFNATFDVAAPPPTTGTVAPRFIHFCLTQAIVPLQRLGRDGHPVRGGFMPPVPLPRRMRAGGSVALHDDLRVGDTVTRTARIAEVAVKEGNSGALCFVTVENRIAVDGRKVLTETEEIVYLPDGDPSGGPARNRPAAAPGTWSRAQPISTTLLFRYSAITFNGHRIHYDRRYAMEVEGYPWPRRPRAAADDAALPVRRGPAWYAAQPVQVPQPVAYLRRRRGVSARQGVRNRRTEGLDRP